MNFSDVDEKRDYLFRYSIRFTAAGALVFAGLCLFGYFFGDSPYFGWFFTIAWIVGVAFILRYFYLWLR